MFERLQRKWKVNGLQLTLIIFTFAIGGSLTGYVARKLMPVLHIDQPWLWVVVYVILITLIWPLMVILISFPFGQFRFFRKYLRKIGRRIGLSSKQSAVGSGQPAAGSRQMPVEVAIFASGTGSNAQKIIDHFKNSSAVHIGLIVCNKPGAGVIGIAGRENIPVLLIERNTFFNGDGYLPELKKHGIGFIILAGFLWKIPTAILNAYTGRIVNIHPALLPGYGGKGMYGNNVHKAVIATGDKESGITIHYVDDQYDHGATIFQARCPIYPDDTAETLAKRIHQLEHEHYPRVIAEVLAKKPGG
jgi:formyltetrahydrofolate-dependent phosphoribosylglycinamide formyltransferase